MKLLDKRFTTLIAAESIQTRIQTLAKTINTDYKGKNPLFLTILNGAFPFLADLAKYVDLPCEFEFVKISSYKGETQAKTLPFMMLGIEQALIQDRDIIVVEDIIDTGKTIEMVMHYLEAKKPRSLKLAALLHKSSIAPNVKIDYLGFEVGDEFLVGYGLDYGGLGRNLQDVYKLAPETEQ